VLLSWNYYNVRPALDGLSFVIFSVLFLLGVGKGCYLGFWLRSAEVFRRALASPEL
jgi:hypothetical protein